MTPRLYGQNWQIFHDSILSQFPEKTWAQRKANQIQKYRKIPKIRPSRYKPLKLVLNAKNLPLNRPPKYKPPGGLCLENCPQIQSKTKQKRQIYFKL